MDGIDFYADSGYQSELAEELKKASADYITAKDKIYEEITKMGDDWQGEDYDLFASETKQYDPALTTVGEVLETFGIHFEKMAEGTEELAAELVKIMSDITGSIAAKETLTAQTPESSIDGNTVGGVDGQAPSGTGTGTGTTTVETDKGTTGGSTDSNTGTGTTGNPGGEKTSNETLTSTGTSGTTGTGSEDVETLDVETESYKSGDTISINGQTYSYYAGYQNPDGSVVHMVADNQGNLYYKDENGNLANVMASHVGGNGQLVEEKATIDSLGQTVTINAHGYNASVPVSLKVGEATISNTDQLSSTVDVQGDSALGAEHIGSGSGFIDNGNTIVSDGSLRESYNGGIFEGTTVNGSTYVKGTSMADFQNYLKPNSDGVVDVTIQIPQGASVQWDPSSAPLNGYDFNTSNGPVYLRWDANAAGGQGAYKIVDQYGNFTGSQEFTLDGFNTNSGSWK